MNVLPVQRNHHLSPLSPLPGLPAIPAPVFLRFHYAAPHTPRPFACFHQVPAALCGRFFRWASTAFSPVGRNRRVSYSPAMSCLNIPSSPLLSNLCRPRHNRRDIYLLTRLPSPPPPLLCLPHDLITGSLFP